ncbi:IS3 family transposase [Streptomyces zaomyceticus]|uniref:IS3 family transposase n=1 Tax=Streptomyces zaomyceticus TaxID=68286 RepID=UPI0034482EE3
MGPRRPDPHPGGGRRGWRRHTPDEKEEFRRLRRENARLKEDNEILRKAAAYFARERHGDPLPFRRRAPERPQGEADLRRSRMGRSGYYTWHQNKEARQEKADEEEGLARRIREIHTDSRRAYGALRITRKLRDHGHVVNRKRVARIMREREIVGITRRKSRSLTKQDRAAPPAPDLILRDFTAPLPGLKFVGDITCLPTVEGWLYLATVIDLCTREVVGWSMADHMRTELVADAIRMAHAGGHTAGNAIFHSAARNTPQANSVPCWASWTFGRAPVAPVRASTMLPRRVSSPS